MYPWEVKVPGLRVGLLQNLVLRRINGMCSVVLSALLSYYPDIWAVEFQGFSSTVVSPGAVSELRLSQLNLPPCFFFYFPEMNKAIAFVLPWFLKSESTTPSPVWPSPTVKPFLYSLENAPSHFSCKHECSWCDLCHHELFFQRPFQTLMYFSETWVCWLCDRTLSETHVQYSYRLSSHIKNYLIGQSKFLWHILFAIYLLGNKWHIIKYVLVPSTLHLSHTSKFLKSLCLVLFFADKESKAEFVCENQGSKTDPESLNCHIVKLVKRWFSNRGQGHGSAEWRSLSYRHVQGLAKGGRGEALVHRGRGKSVIAEHECC